MDLNRVRVPFLFPLLCFYSIVVFLVWCAPFESCFQTREGWFFFFLFLHIHAGVRPDPLEKAPLNRRSGRSVLNLTAFLLTPGAQFSPFLYFNYCRWLGISRFLSPSSLFPSVSVFPLAQCLVPFLLEPLSVHPRNGLKLHVFFSHVSFPAFVSGHTCRRGFIS